MMTKTVFAFVLGITLILSTAVLVHAADPAAPSNITATLTSSYNTANYQPLTIDALAGNITALVVYAIGQTKGWQGYYGNISATITLDDADNFTFYNWTSAVPRGQIYATLNSSITWGGVTCFNFSELSTANFLTIENYYGFTSPDVDGVNETFAQTDHPTFEVGSVTMDDCPTTYIFQNDVEQETNFVNVLLYDPTLNDTGWIYTTVIENRSTATGSPQDLICYNGQPCDFQILVNDDGHGTDTQVTPYYFWVEIL